MSPISSKWLSWNGSTPPVVPGEGDASPTGQEPPVVVKEFAAYPVQEKKKPTATKNDPICYEVISSSAQYILERTSYRPKIAVICGSGLGGLVDLLEIPDIFSYSEIPNFPVSTVVGHAGRLLVGLLEGIEVLVMQGRFHAYEGYELWQTALPVRVMKLLGIESLIVTNAAGGINKEFSVGDIMIINDHLNLPGFCCENPLRGPNDERFGSRFFPANNVYTPQLIEVAKEVGNELGLGPFLREGVYCMCGGPNYETNAEVRLLGLWGVDAVGMSTVPETIVAHHCGIQVFACSLITNKCGEETNHEEVVHVATERAKDMKRFITGAVAAFSQLSRDASPAM